MHINQIIADHNATHHKKYSIWVEGYAATGESSRAHCVTIEPIEARSFDEAVAKYVGTLTGSDRKLWERGKDGQWSMWGCRAYEHEVTARRMYG